MLEICRCSADENSRMICVHTYLYMCVCICMYIYIYILLYCYIVILLKIYIHIYVYKYIINQHANIYIYNLFSLLLKLPQLKKLDDGWPESAEEHVTLVLLKRKCSEDIKDML